MLCCAIDGTAAGLQSDGCSKKGREKGSLGRPSEDPGTEQNSTPPSNHSSIPLPHRRQQNNSQHPLLQHCRFRVAQDQKAGMLALPSPRRLSIPLYPHSLTLRIGASGQFGHPLAHFRLLPFPGCRAQPRPFTRPLKAPNVAPPRAICRPVNHDLCHHLQTPPRPENKASPSRRIPPTTCHPVPAIIPPDCPGLPPSSTSPPPPPPTQP